MHFSGSQMDQHNGRFNELRPHLNNRSAYKKSGDRKDRNHLVCPTFPLYSGKRLLRKLRKSALLKRHVWITVLLKHLKRPTLCHPGMTEPLCHSIADIICKVSFFFNVLKNYIVLLTLFIIHLISFLVHFVINILRHILQPSVVFMMKTYFKEYWRPYPAIGNFTAPCV